MGWVIDGNNVFGSRPDGWWNDRPGAARRLAQRVAEWSRTHDEPVILVFDAPVDPTTLELAGGNLTIEQATRRGRNAADDRIVEIVEALPAGGDELPIVVTSDGGLRRRLEGRARQIGAGRFLELLDGTGSGRGVAHAARSARIPPPPAPSPHRRRASSGWRWRRSPAGSRSGGRQRPSSNASA